MQGPSDDDNPLSPSSQLVVYGIVCSCTVVVIVAVVCIAYHETNLDN